MTWLPGTACEYFLSCATLYDADTVRIDSLKGGLIKVGDFGLAQDMYGTKYYRHERSEGGERVPIRWMAPESIDTNIYNQATDVVS